MLYISLILNCCSFAIKCVCKSTVQQSVDMDISSQTKFSTPNGVIWQPLIVNAFPWLWLSGVHNWLADINTPQQEHLNYIMHWKVVSEIGDKEFPRLSWLHGTHCNQAVTLDWGDKATWPCSLVQVSKVIGNHPGDCSEVVTSISCQKFSVWITLYAD